MTISLEISTRDAKEKKHVNVQELQSKNESTSVIIKKNKTTQEGEDVTPKTRQEYLDICRKRYQACKHKSDRSKILDEIQLNTGYHRDSARKVMKKQGDIDARKGSSGRTPVYSDEAKRHLYRLWLTMGRMGGKTMKEALPEWLQFDFECPIVIKQELLKMSAARIDYFLKPYRKKWRLENNCGTVKAQNRWKTFVPIKPLGLKITKPGTLEVDTVAHCGGSLTGIFAWTLNTKELLTCWTECRVVWGKGSMFVREALFEIEGMVPFKLERLYVDGGTEFINKKVVEDFVHHESRTKPLEIYRSRPYHKNDQCHIEQANHTKVRHLLGYMRIDSYGVLPLLNELLREWCLLQNHFVPQRKLLHKERVGARVRRVYDTPETPYQRVLKCTDIPILEKGRIIEEHEKLNPMELRKGVLQKLDRLHRALRVSQNEKGRYNA